MPEHRDLRRLAFDHFVAFAANGERRVQQDRVPGHHAIEKMPERGQVLLASGDAQILLSQPVKILADIFGRDLDELQAALFRPSQEPFDRIR